MEKERKHLRFYAEPLEIALISTKKKDYEAFSTHEDYHFIPDHVALIDNMSYEGCSLIFIEDNAHGTFLPKDTDIVIKLGKLNPMRAKVAHREKIDTRIVKIGIAILD